jgi:hypothetical protein
MTAAKQKPAPSIPQANGLARFASNAPNQQNVRAPSTTIAKEENTATIHSNTKSKSHPHLAEMEVRPILTIMTLPRQVMQDHRNQPNHHTRAFAAKKPKRLPRHPKRESACRMMIVQKMKYADPSPPNPPPVAPASSKSKAQDSPLFPLRFPPTTSSQVDQK